jgi:hypothetical protein
MKHLLCALALAGFAGGASAQPVDIGGSAPTFAARDQTPAAPQATGARSFNDLVADNAGSGARSDSRIASGVTPAIPEPQTYALLLAGLGAVVFVAVRRRRS